MHEDTTSHHNSKVYALTLTLILPWLPCLIYDRMERGQERVEIGRVLQVSSMQSQLDGIVSNEVLILVEVDGPTFV